MSGGNFAVEENVNSWLGGTFDFGAGYGNRHIDLSQVAASLGIVPPDTPVIAIFRPTIYTFTGGPQFHYRARENFQPFARLLFGSAHSDLGPDTLTQQALTIAAPTFKTTRNSVAGIVGGGVDYVWRDYLAFRACVDFVRIYLFEQHQSNVRVMAGVDFRIGRRYK